MKPERYGGSECRFRCFRIQCDFCYLLSIVKLITPVIWAEASNLEVNLRGELLLLDSIDSWARFALLKINSYNMKNKTEHMNLILGNWYPAL